MEDENGRRTTRSADEDEWKMVERRRSRRTSKGSKNFVFTRFPDTWDETSLRKMFMKYGKVVSLYSATKRSKNGHRFGFVRFRDENDWEAFEKTLKMIIIGNKRISINKEKYGIKPKDSHGFTRRHLHHDQLGEKHRCNEAIRSGSYHVEVSSRMDNRSFKDALRGVKPNPNKMVKDREVANKKTYEGAIELEYLARLQKCWVGKMDMDALRNINHLLKNDGLGQCKIQYIGGFDVLCEWSSKEAAIKSMQENKEVLDLWFSEVKLWDESMMFHERLTWITIEGLPVEAWCDVTLRNIASDFGMIIEVDEPKFNSSMVNTFGVLIVARDIVEINSIVSVKVRSKTCLVKVFEEHNRAIFFDNQDSSEKDEDSRLDEDDFHNDGVSDTFMMNEELNGGDGCVS